MKEIWLRAMAKNELEHRDNLKYETFSAFSDYQESDAKQRKIVFQLSFSSLLYPCEYFHSIHPPKMHSCKLHARNQSISYGEI